MRWSSVSCVFSILAFANCQGCNDFNSNSNNQKVCDACAAGTGGAACSDGSIITMCSDKSNDICGYLPSFCPSEGISDLGYSFQFCCDSWLFNVCEVPYDSTVKCLPPYVVPASICLACQTGVGGPGCQSEEVQNMCQTDPSNVCSVLDTCSYESTDTTGELACCDVWFSQSCMQVNFFSQHCMMYES